MYATLGDVNFEFLNSFSDFEETHSAVFAKHDVLAGRPRLQAMGNDLTTVRFGVGLHWKLGNPDTAYKGLIQAKEAQQAVSLVFGSGRFVGWWVIERVTSRTLKQDGQGRTSARELDVELTEFVGDPNNPLDTPGILSGQNPLLSLLPESVQGAISKVADAVETGVRIYNQVEQGINDVQNLISQAQALKNDPLAMFGLVGDALSLSGSMLGSLNALPEIGQWFGNLSGAVDFLSYTAQAASDVRNAVGIIQNGFDSGSWGDWLAAGASLFDSAGGSIANAAAGAESLTAWLAVRKDGA